jgi:subtilisin family serine protease
MLLSIFLEAVSALNAQETAKYGFELRTYLSTLEKNEMVPLLVEGYSEDLNEIVTQYGGTVRLQVGSLYSIELTANSIPAFSQEEKVKTIEFSTRTGRSLSDTMLIHTNVDSILRQYAPLRVPYTGKGVILGVIDSGIELAHGDFRDTNGNTRVLYVWDQGVPYDPSLQASHYNYGVEWDSASINTGLSTHDDKANEFGHGSNVTGAAASNGLATGHFKGVAPEVNIISVATDFRKPNWLQTVAEAVDYIYEKAEQLGMPCVINASVGTYVGSHDGKDIAARMIDALIRQKSGRAFVCAAGNAGNIPFHLQHVLQNDTSFTWFESHPAQWSGQGGIYFELWSDTLDFKNVQFAFGADKETNGRYTFRGRTAFTGIQNRLNTIYTDSIMSFSGNKLATISTYAEESQGRYKLEVAIVRPDSSDYLFRLESIGTGKLDVWSSYSLFRHSNMVRTGLPGNTQFPSIINYQKPDTLQTMVSSFTCLPSVITVGNYYNRNTYTDVSGTFRNMGIIPGAISSNSSLGPNRNLHTKPDIASAGDFIFASGRLATLQDAIQFNPVKVSFDSLHFRNGGTSLASPTVAGMVALYFQMCPQADFQKVFTDLTQSAKQDQFTGNLPNPIWGYGKADGFQFIKRNVYTPSLLGAQINNCEGDTISLSTVAAIDYLWSNGDTTPSIKVYETGTHYALLTNSSGCQSPTDTVSINFHPLPGQPSIIQNGNQLTINATGQFQWYLNQSIIPNATSASYTAQANGDYYCIYSDLNNCSISSDTLTVIVTSLEEQKKLEDFSIEPNPGNGNFRLSFPYPVSINKMTLYSVTGRKVWEKKRLQSIQQFEVKLSPLPKGIYFLQIQVGSQQSLKKVIIQ